MKKIVVYSLVLLISICSRGAIAQTLNMGVPDSTGATKPKTEDPQHKTNITEVKVLNEYLDKKTGNIVREIQYKEGAAIIRETHILPPFPSPKDRKPVDPDTLNGDSLMVLVDKTNYLVAVIYKKKRIRQYRAVFGPNRLKDKMCEGDRCTPEGWFKVLSVRDHGAWQKFMLLDYPNQESYKRFNQRVSDHDIPSNSRIGGAIGIHGIFKGGDEMVDLGIGWTDGCVSLKSTDIVDLFKFVKPGTRVYVRR